LEDGVALAKHDNKSIIGERTNPVLSEWKYLVGPEKDLNYYNSRLIVKC
jgi:hypothetical protein